MGGQIIIVSGTSGSGKSTTCERFAKRSKDFWLVYGIDHFLAATYPSQFGHRGARDREGIYAHPVDEKDPDGTLRWSFGPQGTRAFAVMHEWIAAASRQGCNIIVDHLMLIDPPILQDCIWRLNDLPVLSVSLKPPYDVLMQRVATRKMGGKATAVPTDAQAQRIVERLQRLRPWFYEASYANTICDLELDTTQLDVDAVCDRITERLEKGPGSAFEELRRRYSR